MKVICRRAEMQVRPATANISIRYSWSQSLKSIMISQITQLLKIRNKRQINGSQNQTTIKSQILQIMLIKQILAWQ